MSFVITLNDFIVSNEKGQLDINPRIRAVIRATGVPIRERYDLSKIGKKLEGELEQYVETRTTLFKELGEEEVVEGKPTNNWKLKSENLEEFNKQHKELLEKTVTIDVNPMKFSALGDKAEGFTGDDLIACHAFITE